MSRHAATVEWQRSPLAAFTDGRYSRAHVWRFDGGAEVPASSSPHVVPLPFSAAERVDPEEAFVAALASCHMLFFLSGAAKAGFVVERYEDAAEGMMEPDAEGRLAMVRVVLSPTVRYAGSGPDHPTEAALHRRAHAQCFLANSVRARIEIRLDQGRADVRSVE
jgi:organic hydroperoxide reductase OsmC/OhrA